MTRDELLKAIELLAWNRALKPIETLGRIRDLFREFDSTEGDEAR
jgi:hypothetical protein